MADRSRQISGSGLRVAVRSSALPVYGVISVAVAVAVEQELRERPVQEQVLSEDLPGAVGRVVAQPETCAPLPEQVELLTRRCLSLRPREERVVAVRRERPAQVVRLAAMVRMERKTTALKVVVGVARIKTLQRQRVLAATAVSVVVGVALAEQELASELMVG